jgi:meiosis arrest female protein 1
VVELFKNAPQYSILFKKFVRSYHYHFGYQCRLSDYGFLKLADLLEAIGGVVEMEATNDEDRKIFLSPKLAQRVFVEQTQDIIKYATGNHLSMVRLTEILNFHKNKYGYQIQPQCLGFANMFEAILALPYIEVFKIDDDYTIVCHLEDPVFRSKAYVACACFVEADVDKMPLTKFLNLYARKLNENLNDKLLFNMKHAITVRAISLTF